MKIEKKRKLEKLTEKKNTQVFHPREKKIVNVKKIKPGRVESCMQEHRVDLSVRSTR